MAPYDFIHIFSNLKKNIPPRTFVDGKHQTILMKWIINFNSRINNKRHIWQTYCIWVKVCNYSKELTCYVISLPIFYHIVQGVKFQCMDITTKLVKELQVQFPQHVINKTLDIICSHSKYL
jgi:hypothetical protein